MDDRLQTYLFQLIEGISGTLERIEASLAKIENVTCNPPFTVKSPADTDFDSFVNRDGSTGLQPPTKAGTP
jgi:hypothetical protein